MFVLTEMSDLVLINPNSFNEPIDKAALEELNRKYSDRVIKRHGLGISVFDLSEIQEGLLRQSEGGVYVKVKFRCIVWKPFVGEVLTGSVFDCTPEGIKVRLDFFDDIFVPKMYLFENCFFKSEEKAWVWKPEEGSELYIDINDEIRFRVEEECFSEVKQKSSTIELGKEEKNALPPYFLIASCQTDGMGCASWWD